MGRKPADSPTQALRDAVAAAGGVTALAAKLTQARRRISHQAVSQWRIVPAAWVLAVEAVTGVARARLRPDFYPVDRAGE